MSIRQLNASYAPEEDRVMLRFTTDIQEEYRFWLTRAVVAALLQQAQTLAVKALEQHHSVQQAKAVAKFKQQTLAQTATFTQFEGATRFPFGAEPVLVKLVEDVLCNLLRAQRAASAHTHKERGGGEGKEGRREGRQQTVWIQSS
jgi:hypothetical protein